MIKMGVLEILDALNIIELFDVVLPKGIGELITLSTFIGFFFLAAVYIAQFVITREILLVHLKAKIFNKTIGLVALSDGSLDHILLDRSKDSYKRKDSVEWIIEPDEKDHFSNGVRAMILHPEIGHNVSINTLCTFYSGSARKLIYSAREVRSRIGKIAEMDAARVKKRGEQLMMLGLVAAIILAIGIAGYFLTDALANYEFCSAASEAIRTGTVQATTTTLAGQPPVSGVS